MSQQLGSVEEKKAFGSPEYSKTRIFERLQLFLLCFLKRPGAAPPCLGKLRPAGQLPGQAGAGVGCAGLGPAVRGWTGTGWGWERLCGAGEGCASWTGTGWRWERLCQLDREGWSWGWTGTDWGWEKLCGAGAGVPGWSRLAVPLRRLTSTGCAGSDWPVRIMWERAGIPSCSRSWHSFCV